MSHWGSWLPTSTTLGLHAEPQWIAHFREKPLVDAANWVPGTPGRRAVGVQSMLALFKVCREKRNVLGFSLRQWRVGRLWLGRGRQPLLDMLSTTHERNPTFPCGSFPWIRHAPRSNRGVVLDSNLSLCFFRPGEWASGLSAREQALESSFVQQRPQGF